MVALPAASPLRPASHSNQSLVPFGYGFLPLITSGVTPLNALSPKIAFHALPISLYSIGITIGASTRPLRPRRLPLSRPTLASALAVPAPTPPASPAPPSAPDVSRETAVSVPAVRNP